MRNLVIAALMGKSAANGAKINQRAAVSLPHLGVHQHPSDLNLIQTRFAPAFGQADSMDLDDEPRIV